MIRWKEKTKEKKKEKLIVVFCEFLFIEQLSGVREDGNVIDGLSYRKKERYQKVVDN